MIREPSDVKWHREALMEMADLGFSMRLEYQYSDPIVIDLTNFQEASKLIKGHRIRYIEFRYDGLIYATAYLHGLGTAVRIFQGVKNQYSSIATALLDTRISIQVVGDKTLAQVIERIFILVEKKMSERKSIHQKQKVAIVMKKLGVCLERWYPDSISDDH